MVEAVVEVVAKISSGRADPFTAGWTFVRGCGRNDGMAKAKLNPRQQQFVDEYLKDFNATQAAVRCGYSKRTAYSQGHDLLKLPEVREAVEKAKLERSRRTKIDADWLLTRLAEEANADLSDLYDPETGALKPIREWPKIWRQGLVQGVETVEERDDEGNVIGRALKVKIDNRVKRLELIGKHIGVRAFEERVNVTGLDALADRLARAKARKGGNAEDAQ